MKTKKVGVSTGTIINPRLERAMKKKEDKINKGKNCNKCISYYKKNSWCYKYNFRVSSIELGSKCKDYNAKSTSYKSRNKKD